jgi:two-component system NtrC family sensor kinase
VSWRDRLAWRLSAIVTLNVALVIVAVALLGALLSRHFALESARSTLDFNSISLRSGIDRLMMSRNKGGVRELIHDVSRGSDVYLNVRLISHPSGQIAVSRNGAPAGRLSEEDRSCLLCHASGEPSDVTAQPLDVVYRDEDGRRLLRVVTPILNEPGCRSGDCHAHAESGPLLGFLEADYSLAGVDSLMRNLGLFLTLSALVAVIVATAGLLLTFRRLLARPLKGLVTGLGALAAGDRAFRFPAVRKDEIGLVEKSFNRLASRIETQEADLREAFEYLEGIVENSADLIITVNPDGLIQTFNRGAEQALGYKREEVVGRHIETLFADPRERDAAIAGLEELDNVTNYEARFLTKGGEVRHVLLTLSRLRDREGNTIGTFGISKDITNEKELQRKLMQSEKAAAIGMAVTGIQHAVKNMLNTLRGGLYLIDLGYKKGQWERVKEGSDMVEEGFHRISDLSLNMLKYARDWTIEPEPTDVAALVGKIVSAVERRAEELGVELLSEVNPSLPAVSCDPKLIHMGLMDIVTNALEACESKEYGEGERAKIVLRVSRDPDGGDLVLEIEDNGIGMTEKAAAHVFTPFFSTKKSWGTGLGMALTARIIELHGGKISVQSKPDKGTKFRIALPIDGPGTHQGESHGQEDTSR